MVINMKKIFLLIIVVFILVGCQLNNNPTSKVEELLGKYQGLDKSIDYNYIDLSSNINLNANLSFQYEELIKRQYRNLSYDIKDEVINGDAATVSVEIEVFDYKSVLSQYDLNEVRSDEVHQNIIDKLKKVNKKIVYTVDFFVTRDQNDEWLLVNLTTGQNQKLLGIY